MSAITAKASRKMKKYAVLTREPRCFLGSFDFSWEQRKVSDLAEKTYGGGTPTTSNEAYWNGDIPWIQSSDVVDGKLLGVEPRKWITQDGLNNSAAQLIPGNSIAIITRVGVGKLAFMPYSYATSQDFLSLSKLNAEPLFTVYACYKKLQSELNAVQGTSIKGITKDELLAKNIMVPRYAEQQQIGAFFKQLDNLITLHQRKCVFLFGFFQTFISMIFTASTFSWEQRKLGELVDVCSGRDYKHLSEGTIPVYGTGGYMLSVNDALSYDRDAIGIGRKGTIDRPYILKAPFWTVDTLFYAIPREKADLNFAFDIFQNIDWKKKDESTGVPSLSKTAINDIDVLAPKHGEQQTIGQFFAAIDHLITLHQRKPFLMKWRTSDANRNQTNRLVL